MEAWSFGFAWAVRLLNEFHAKMSILAFKPFLTPSRLKPNQKNKKQKTKETKYIQHIHFGEENLQEARK